MKEKRVYFSLVALFLFLTLSFYHHFSKGEARYPASSYNKLNMLVEQMLHRVSLLTIAGKKPISTIELDGELKDQLTPLEAFQIIKEGVLEQKIKNSDLIFFQVIQSHQNGSPIYINMVASRKSLLERIHSSDLISLYEKYSIEIPQDEKRAIELFKEASLQGGFIYSGPREANIVIGTLLGFPAKDVETYVEIRKLENSVKDSFRDNFLNEQYSERITKYQKYGYFIDRYAMFKNPDSRTYAEKRVSDTELIIRADLELQKHFEGNPLARLNAGSLLTDPNFYRSICAPSASLFF